MSMVEVIQAQIYDYLEVYSEIMSHATITNKSGVSVDRAEEVNLGIESYGLLIQFYYISKIVGFQVMDFSFNFTIFQRLQVFTSEKFY